MGIDVSTLLPEPEPEAPFPEADLTDESIISEAALPGLEILEGLSCDKHGDIWKEGKLVGKIDRRAGKKSIISKCYKRTLVCSRDGELMYGGNVVARARLITTEEASSVGAEEWGESFPLESSGVVVF